MLNQVEDVRLEIPNNLTVFVGFKKVNQSSLVSVEPALFPEFITPPAVQTIPKRFVPDKTLRLDAEAHVAR